MPVEYKRGEGFVYRNIAGEHLLVAMQKDQLSPLYTFTPTGAVLWEELITWRSPGMLADYLVERYDVTSENAARDVADFLRQLESLNALQTREVSE